MRSVTSEVQRLHALTAGDPARRRQVDSLEALVASRVAVSREIVALRRDRGFEAARQATAGGPGLALQARIRGLITHLGLTERTQLADLGRRSTTTAVMARTVIGTGAILAFVFVAVALAFVRRDFIARMAAENRLQRQAALIDHTFDAVISWMWDGPITFWNRGAERLYGIPRAAAMGRRPAELLGTSCDAGLTGVMATLERDGSWVGELTHSTAAGDRIAVDSNMVLVRGPNRPYVLEANRDATVRLNAEAVLRNANTELEQRVRERTAALADLNRELTESESRYRSLVEQAPDGIVVVAADGRFLEANAAGLAVLGHSLASLRRLKVADLVDRDERDRFRVEMARVRDGAIAGGEWRLQRINGAAIDIEVVAKRLEDGRIQAILHDITERKRTTAMRDRLAAIVESSDDAILATASGGTVIAWNGGAERLFGYPAAEALGANLYDLIIPADRQEEANAMLERVAHGETVEHYETKRKRRDGTLIDISVTLSPTIDAAGRILGASAVARDITERNRAAAALRHSEEQLRQAQKMEAIGQLAGGVAHDFNNLLAVISMFTEMVTEQMSPDDARRRDLEQVQEAAHRAATLTRQLLAFSRRQVLQPVKLDPNTVITGLAKMLGRLIGEPIELVLQLDERAGLVKADAGQLEQVIMNLAVNARDAMPAGGRLTISTGQVTLDAARATAMGLVEPGPHVTIAVTDNGTGMTPEVQARIFEPFFTTKEHKGTGLGLATVYGIVQQSRGHVNVSSRPGAGSTFTVILPRVSGEAAEPAGTTASPLGGHETILLAEDERVVRRAAQQVLEHFGYAVMAAESGPEALELSRRHHGELNLLVTDVVMPGMNGRQLYNALHAQRPDLRVLFMSGYAGDALNGCVGESGLNFLEKPFTSATLAARVRQVLDVPQSPDAQTPAPSR